MSSSLAENLFTRRDQIKCGITSDIKTCLVVQGGGMRGIYSMASLMALEECGLGGAFDHVIGSSAGAINCAYMLAEQAKMAVTVYLDDISNKRFVNFFRLNKIVDIDYLVDDVLKKKKALNVSKVLNSVSTLHIVLTDYNTGKSAVLTNRERELNLMEAIRATAALPILYNKVVQVNGKKYIDGGLTDAVPLIRAITLGCTDILVVLTREPSFRRRRPNFFLRLLEKPFLKSYPIETSEVILSEDTHFNKTMEVLGSMIQNTQERKLAVVYPSDLKEMVSRTTSDRSKLLRCALMARNDTRKALGLKVLDDNPFE